MAAKEQAKCQLLYRAQVSLYLKRTEKGVPALSLALMSTAHASAKKSCFFSNQNFPRLYLPQSPYPRFCPLLLPPSAFPPSLPSSSSPCTLSSAFQSLPPFSLRLLPLLDSPSFLHPHSLLTPPFTPRQSLPCPTAQSSTTRFALLRASPS